MDKQDIDRITKIISKTPISSKFLNSPEAHKAAEQGADEAFNSPADDRFDELKKYLSSIDSHLANIEKLLKERR